jgi:hypothetical protein
MADINKQVKEFEELLLTKPRMRAAFKQSLGKQIVKEFNRPAGLLGSLYGSNWALALGVAGVILVSLVGGMLILNRQNFLSGNNSIAGNKSSTASNSGSAITTSDGLAKCAAEYTDAKAPGFALKYDRCVWKKAEINLPQGENEGEATLTSDKGELKFNFELNKKSTGELECYQGSYTSLDKGYLRYQRDGAEIYLSKLSAWKQNGDAGQQCIASDVPFLTKAESGTLYISISYRGNDVEQADKVILDMKLNVPAGVSSSSQPSAFVLPAKWSYVQMTQQCNIRVALPPLGASTAFGTKPPKGLETYSPYDYNGMYWQRFGAEDGLDAGIPQQTAPNSGDVGFFVDSDGVRLVHEAYVRKNYAGSDGGLPGELAVYCGPNINGMDSNQFAAAYKDYLLKQIPPFEPGQQVTVKKLTLWGKTVYRLNSSLGFNNAKRDMYVYASSRQLYLVSVEATDYGDYHEQVAGDLAQMLASVEITD